MAVYFNKFSIVWPSLTIIIICILLTLTIVCNTILIMSCGGNNSISVVKLYLTGALEMFIVSTPSKGMRLHELCV